MARLYKPVVTRYVDPDGRRCKKGDPGARKVKANSKTWRGEFRDHDGVLRTKSLCTNKEAARQMLQDLVKQAQHERAGLVSQFDRHAKRVLSEHLGDFERHLQAKNRARKHVAKYVSYIRRVAEACEWRYLRDLSDNDLTSYLHQRREAGMSTAASNDHVAACKAFGNWLVKSRPQRWPQNPFAAVEKLEVETDRRLVRRPATAEELTRLIEATRESEESFRGLSGDDRAMLYLVAANSGLRASELASLTTESLQFDGDQPVLVVEAGYSKRRRRDQQPIRSDLAAALRDWIEERSADKPAVLSIERPAPAKLWPGTWHEKAAVMLRKDLAAARAGWLAEAKVEAEIERREQSDFLDPVDHHGRVFDFHSLRGTFATALSKAGVAPKVAQDLMRHSDINLTMSVYTRLELAEVAVHLDKLPALPAKQAVRATGTDARPVVAAMVAGLPDGPRGSGRIPEADAVVLAHRPETNKPPQLQGPEVQCGSLMTGDGEPPVRLELTTYALRKRRSAN